MKVDRAALLSVARVWLLHISGLILAAGVAALLSVLLLGNIDAATAAFVVALAHALLFGMPAYFVVRARGRFAWWLAPLCGFAIGALPVGLLTLGGFGAEQASVGNVATVVDGVRTWAGWLEYLQVVGAAGLLGAAAALAFALAIRSTLPRPADAAPFHAASPGWSPWNAIPILLAVLTVCLFLWIPITRVDRSCHNPLRNGGTSIASAIEAEITIDVADWRDFDRLLRLFAQRERWSYRGYVRTDDDFKWLDVSICDEAGTEIHALDPATSVHHQIDLSVVQPQGGLSWRQPYKDLYRQLVARWPGRIHFRDQRGNYMPPPAWLAGP